MHRHRVIATIALVALALVACGGDDPVESVTATASPIVSPSPSPSPSPTPDGARAPFTGELVDPQDAARPVLAVKIENTRKAQPQAGLEQADLVFEELVEGGITRFLAVFQSTVPDEVGPIRSARLVDAGLLPALDGVLVYSGGRPDVEAALSGTALRITEGDPGVYRVGERSRPSNLFAEPEAVYAEALARDADLSAPDPWFRFAEEPSPGACEQCDGTELEIVFSPDAVTGWSWDEDAGVYRRRQGSTPQPTASGDPVGAANVVVVEVSTFNGGCCDTNGAPYVVTDTTGDGRAIVLRGGQWYEGRWERPSESDPWVLTLDGEELAFAIGPTWIHLVPSARMPAQPSADEGP